MTKAQLESIEIKMNEWVSLENKFCNIQLWNDGRLYPTETSQYYFDSSNSLVYVKYVNKVGNKIYTFAGGTNATDIGTFHEVFTFEAITSMQ